MSRKAISLFLPCCFVSGALLSFSVSVTSNSNFSFKLCGQPLSINRFLRSEILPQRSLERGENGASQKERGRGRGERREEKLKIAQIFQVNQLFQLLNLVRIYGHGFFELSRKLMRAMC